MALMFRAAAMASALVGTTFFASPAMAAPLSAAPLMRAPSGLLAASRYEPADAIADWRCRGWNCGRRGWRRDRVDAGDVLIGAAVIGGIAAIISANNRRERERDVVIVQRDPDFRDRDRDWRRDDRRAGPRGAGASGLDNAVSMCLDRIERDVRVDGVDSVERTAAGWQVRGSLFNGAGFDCRIGNDGQIETINYDGSFGAGDWREDRAATVLPRGEGQWDDSRYTSARAAVGGTVRPDMAVSEAEMRAAPVDVPRSAATSAMPAYPGGPVPGEVIPETIDEDIGG